MRDLERLILNGRLDVPLNFERRRKLMETRFVEAEYGKVTVKTK
jgi:hypothetical protein